LNASSACQYAPALSRHAAILNARLRSSVTRRLTASVSEGMSLSESAAMASPLRCSGWKSGIRLDVEIAALMVMSLAGWFCAGPRSAFDLGPIGVRDAIKIGDVESQNPSPSAIVARPGRTD